MQWSDKIHLFRLVRVAQSDVGGQAICKLALRCRNYREADSKIYSVMSRKVLTQLNYSQHCSSFIFW
jgi:hypothetical protein